MSRLEVLFSCEVDEGHLAPLPPLSAQEYPRPIGISDARSSGRVCHRTSLARRFRSLKRRFPTPPTSHVPWRQEGEPTQVRRVPNAFTLPQCSHCFFYYRNCVIAAKYFRIHHGRRAHQKLALAVRRGRILGLFLRRDDQACKRPRSL